MTQRTQLRKANVASDAATLEQIPNIGLSVADDLRGIGIHTPNMLIGTDPYALYAHVCTATGTRHDPCLIDTFIAAVRFMEGAPRLPWWHYTEERKRTLAAGKGDAPSGFRLR